MQTKCMKKKLDGKYTRKLGAVLNTSWEQYPIKQEPKNFVASITQTKQYKRDMRDTEEELRTNSKKVLSYGIFYISARFLAHQQRFTYTSSVWTFAQFGGLAESSGWWERMERKCQKTRCCLYALMMKMIW